MSMDITHCDGNGCPIKDKCRRNDYFRKTGNYGIKKMENNYSSFMTPPFKINKGKFECEMFWGDNADYLLQELKSIMQNGKQK